MPRTKSFADRFWLVFHSALYELMRQLHTHCFCLLTAVITSADITTLVSIVIKFVLSSHKRLPIHSPAPMASLILEISFGCWILRMTLVRTNLGDKCLPKIHAGCQDADYFWICYHPVNRGIVICFCQADFVSPTFKQRVQLFMYLVVIRDRENFCSYVSYEFAKRYHVAMDLIYMLY